MPFDPVAKRTISIFGSSTISTIGGESPIGSPKLPGVYKYKPGYFGFDQTVLDPGGSWEWEEEWPIYDPSGNNFGTPGRLLGSVSTGTPPSTGGSNPNPSTPIGNSRDQLIKKLLDKIFPRKDNTSVNYDRSNFGRDLINIINKYSNKNGLKSAELKLLFRKILEVLTVKITNADIFDFLLNYFAGNFKRTDIETKIAELVADMVKLLNEIMECLELIELSKKWLEWPSGDMEERENVRRVLETNSNRLSELMGILRGQQALLEYYYILWLEKRKKLKG